ncbi:putative mitochondrial protein [Cucumis melo var. makuwa]|uniref:Putative mitochondrial protein n=1 Tax=Cucumis melo var. makuwa TaxID=1194695 RepID=A0A5D3DJ25_CUCMM|nr:putative mitochondrial protein [Cucumis melo var. makuwa]
MSYFMNILCLLVCPLSTPPSQVLIFSLPIHQLISFLFYTPDIELPQFVLAPTNPYQPSFSNDVLEPTPNTHLCRSTWRLILTLTALLSIIRLVLLQKDTPKNMMDFKNAFFNKTLFEEVYIKPPPGTSPPLHKVFASSPYDTALFTHHTPHDIVLLLLYVDDMIITGNDPQVVSNLQHYLGQHLEMKDLGSLNYFFGLEVFRRLNRYLLSQAKYASDLLVRSRITNFNTALTLLDPNVHLIPFDGVPFEDFKAAPRTIHFISVLCILRYIKETFRHGLQFSSQSSLVLFGYSGTYWVRDSTDPRSTTVTVSTYEILLFLGAIRNKVLSLVPVLNQNIVLLLILPKNSYSSIGSFLIWVPLNRILPFFMVTIAVSSKLFTMMFFMSV